MDKRLRFYFALGKYFVRNGIQLVAFCNALNYLFSNIFLNRLLGSDMSHHLLSLFWVNHMIDKYNEATWHIMPQNTPLILRHCSKCNRKMEYYCSEKFRINSNSKRADIWLIYKCSKCDTTLKLTINKGIKPQDMTSELFDQFTCNDADLAWKYAFNRHFLKQNECVVNYNNVKYIVKGLEARKWDRPFVIHLKSPFIFDLKLSTFLAGVFGISISQLRAIVDSGRIIVNPVCDIMKHRIKSDMDIYLQPLIDIL